MAQTRSSAFRALALCILSAYWRFAVRLNLSPVYGGLVASRFQSIVAYLPPALALVALVFLPKGSSAASRAALAAASARWSSLVAAVSAVALHLYLPRASRVLGPEYGPIVTTLACWLPVSAIGYLSTLLPWAEQLPVLGPLAMTGYAVDWTLSTVLEANTALLSSTCTRWGLLVLGVSLYALLFPSSRRILPLIALGAVFALQNPHSPFAPAVLDRTLAEHGFEVLHRSDSVTGYVSVVQNNRLGFRALRCDHSLLGGDWLVTPEARAHGMQVPEPIYPVFTTLEAVRLMEPLPAARRGVARRALVIGLGVGTCPAALAKHGINTTAVELDPAVTRYAREYFDLPDTVAVIDRDALSFVDSIQDQVFDFVVHDVFTGGAEPTALFERDFLHKLQQLLEPAGSIAINYAGDLAKAETWQALTSIASVFGGNCKAFRDNERAANGDDFANISLFCKKAGQAWRFRKAVEQDYLGSMSRREHLVPRLTVALDAGSPAADASAGLAREEAASASACNHWRIMRKVLPDAVWETW